MNSLQVSEDIVPLATFKSQASTLLRQCQSTGRPVVITQHGKPAAVVLDPASYDALTYRARFVSAVDEGLRDAEAGRVISDEELEVCLNAEFGE